MKHELKEQQIAKQLQCETPLMHNINSVVSISIDQIDIHCCCKHFFVEFQNWSKRHENMRRRLLGKNICHSSQ